MLKSERVGLVLQVQNPRPGMVLNVSPLDCHATPSVCRVIGEVDQKKVHRFRLQVFCDMRRQSYPIQNHRY